MASAAPTRWLWRGAAPRSSSTTSAGARDGRGASSAAARAVVDEIESQGGEALADGADVTDFAQVEAMVAAAMERWGRVDVLVNNAGILRDKSFRKMELEDFFRVLAVHLNGSVHCTKAVWAIMQDQGYGRIAMTTSSSGLYGNFGQANYGAAKMAVVGLMNTLAIEGAKYDIRVNTPRAVRRDPDDRGPHGAAGARAAGARSGDRRPPPARLRRRAEPDDPRRRQQASSPAPPSARLRELT